MSDSQRPEEDAGYLTLTFDMQSYSVGAAASACFYAGCNPLLIRFAGAA